MLFVPRQWTVTSKLLPRSTAESSLERNVEFVVFVVCLFCVSACATPVGVTRVDPQTAYHNLTANALASGNPSSFSVQLLLNLSLYEAYDDDPAGALAKLHGGLAPTGGSLHWPSFLFCMQPRPMTKLTF